MSIGVASVQQKEFITASAVYYRKQRFAAESAVVEVAVVGQACWPNVWHQRVWNSTGNSGTVLDIMSSGTLSDIRISGTLSDIRNSGTAMA